MQVRSRYSISPKQIDVPIARSMQPRTTEMEAGIQLISRTRSPRTARPRLLFLAWNFPPVRAIASVRTWNMAKHLARLGWDVTVVSPRPELWRHLDGTGADIKLAGIRQILTGHRWRCLCPSELNCRDRGIGWVLGGMCRTIARRLGIDGGMGWIAPAKRACLALLRPGDTDLIFASGPPFMAFLLAERLSQKLGCPYVLDYRDPWEIPGMIQALRPTATQVERRLLNRAAAVTIVSDSWAADLNSRYKLGPKLQVITNGYDSEELANVVSHDFGHFAIVYAGIFYPPDRVVTPTLAALKRLKTNGAPYDWYFH